MLDFLLLRREDRNLWAANDPDTLQYVVLDEFHTYDGAQGTDVAMLLRRLGATLRMATTDAPLGGAVPVATSATLGSGLGAADDLREFAGKVFGTKFDPESVIGERRQSVEATCGPVDYALPIPDVHDVLGPSDDELDAVAAAFCRKADDGPGPDLTDPVELGQRLLAHPLTRAVLTAVGERARTWTETVAEIISRAPTWGAAHQLDPEAVQQALGRYLALLSFARRRQGDRLRPLFSVEVQLWVREVSRLLRAVEATPQFRWRDSAAGSDADEDDAWAMPGSELPAVYCRRCGLSGWMAIKSELGNQYLIAVPSIYQAALNRSPRIRTLLRADGLDPNAGWYDPSARTLGERREDVGDGAVPVHVLDSDEDARQNRCPACRETDAIRFLGLAVASLASVTINTMFGSPHLEEEERKLLAFTDSVQDASHRAAFFAGRTHRINLRTQMTGIIVDRGQLRLDEMGDELWNRADTDRDRFGLVPPDLLHHRTVRTVWTDDPKREGQAILRSRLAFEAELEFGLRARVGRTIELARAAAAHVDTEATLGVVGLIREHLQTLTGDDHSETAERIEIYARGLPERLRLRGAIAHPFLEPYIADNGRQWLIWGGRPDGLPPFTPGQGRPTFTTTATTGDFDSITAIGTTPTWAVDWAQRTLGLDSRIARDLNVATMALLAKESDVVRATSTSAGQVYSLLPGFVILSDLPEDSLDDPGGAGLRCSLCGNRHNAPVELAASWVHTPCLRYRCAGRYEFDRPDPGGYYRRLYRSGVTRRVVTGEHTGMLRREARERLETAFKAGTAPDAPNVLTATPTLEMGIDIGDLSAVMLTSVPRSPASYIQRVGRAGRATGNALITTFVRTDSHGLYYLADPEAMIAGDVRPPNCYLDADEILQRQYTGYLFDRISDLTIEAPPMSAQIGPIMRDGLDAGGFLDRVIAVSTSEPHHADAFLDLFGEHVGTAAAESLRQFADHGIRGEIETAVATWKAQGAELELRRRRLTDTIKKLDALPHRSPDDDADLSSLRGQRAAITMLENERRNEYTLSALERLGILPNYNLVDDSATLAATTWAVTDDGYEVTKTDYQRPAALALREFAPGNSFYAAGQRHVVDALEIGSSEQPLTERWRLCPACGYGELATDGPPPAWCVRCGSRAIADAGSLHTLMRLRTALSSGSEESVRVYDEDDERKRLQYDVITTVDVDPTSVTGAWRLTDRIFGAEVANACHLRTINLGFSERRGDQLPIAGADRHISRFTVCRRCGAARDVRDDRNGARPERLHQGWCRVRSGSAKAEWEPLLLYHQLTTEAVRVLLPVSMFEVEERLASFVGALRLGLREDFGGDPDHLDVVPADMPNPGGQGRRRFIVLYDRIPGGTGYLTRLAEPERLKDILEKARTAIARCPCQGEGRVACHRCLLGVVDRPSYELVRRDLALELLDDLLANWDVDTSLDAGLGSIDIGKVEESELERRFKVALTEWASRPSPIPGTNVTFTSVPGTGIHEAFDLRLTLAGVTTRYRIAEQAGLGTTPNTIPDFVIKRMDQPGRDVAVYLDGYQFHASPTNNNLADDAAKRAGIRATGRLVWNLTWDDVEAFHRAVTSDPPQDVPLTGLLTGQERKVAQELQLRRAQPNGINVDALNQNPLALLMDYLSRPDDRWHRVVTSAVAGLASNSERVVPVAAADLRSSLREALGASPVTATGVAPTEAAALLHRHVTANDLAITLALDLADPNAERWTAIAALPDDEATVATDQHRKRWQEWLRWANLLQFLDHGLSDAVISAVSTGADVPLDSLWLLDGTESSVTSVPAEAPATQLTAEQADELGLVASDVAPLVKSAFEAGAPVCVAGYELEDGTMLEVAWPERRVGVIRDDDTPVERPGWVIRRAGDWDAMTLTAAIEEAG